MRTCRAPARTSYFLWARFLLPNDVLIADLPAHCSLCSRSGACPDGSFSDCIMCQVANSPDPGSLAPRTAPTHSFALVGVDSRSRGVIALYRLVPELINFGGISLLV